MLAVLSDTGLESNPLWIMSNGLRKAYGYTDASWRLRKLQSFDEELALLWSSSELGDGSGVLVNGSSD